MRKVASARLALVAVVPVLVSACADAPADPAESVGVDEAAIGTNAAASPWGYDLPLPYFQLPAHVQSLVRSRLPIESVGAVITEKPPFRATATYLGRHNGMYLFGIAGHVAFDRVPTAVEFGHTATSTQKFAVPVESDAIFRSDAGDVAIVRSAANLVPAVAARLEAMRPVRWSFTSLSALVQKYSGAPFVFVARGSYAVAMAGIEGEGGAAPTPLWSAAAGAMWKNASTEAQANLDARTDVAARVGDVLAITTTRVLGRGKTVATRDPDGLVMGQPGGSPFLQAGVDWAPMSLAGTFYSFGRMSGGPVFMLTPKGPVVVGVDWTAGVTQDIKPLLPKVADDPLRAFGLVVSRPQADGTAALTLLETAPFSYASVMERAGEDLRIGVTNETAGPNVATREALREVFAEASASP